MARAEVGSYDFLLMMWAPLHEGFEVVVPHYNVELAQLGNMWWEALPEKKRRSETRKIALAKKMMARPEDPASWQRRCIVACEIARQHSKGEGVPSTPFESMDDLQRFVTGNGKPPLFSVRISSLYQAAQAAVNGQPAKCGRLSAETLTNHSVHYKRLREIIDVWCEI